MRHLADSGATRVPLDRFLRLIVLMTTARRAKARGAEEFLPEERTLSALRDAAAHCEGCPLFEAATQTVFGEGPSRARIILVGEVPGDAEDRAGRPFVGPAGKLLERALTAAGLERESVYLTNAVKHFYFEPRGKARLHKRPRPGDIRACRPWLDAEIEAIRPRVIVLLGATAAQSLLGSSFRVSRNRGLLDELYAGARVVATLHPAAALRAPDHDARERLFEDLVTDLRVAKAAAGRVDAPARRGRPRARGTKRPSRLRRSTTRSVRTRSGA